MTVVHFFLFFLYFSICLGGTVVPRRYLLPELVMEIIVLIFWGRGLP